MRRIWMVTGLAVTALSLGACASSASKPPSTSSGPNNGLTGIGATVAGMKALHGSASGPGSCSSANACFGFGLSNTESGKTYQFTDVSTAGGLITGYQENFAPGTTTEQAQQYVLQGFPKDAVASPIMVDHKGGSCAVYNVTSPTLARLFRGAPSVGDPRGIIGVELSTTTSSLRVVYDTSDVEDATLSVLPVKPTDSC